MPVQEPNASVSDTLHKFKKLVCLSKYFISQDKRMCRGEEKEVQA